jgi:uncharacterized protein (TIGR01777 family)
MKIILAGGSGLIGRELAAALLAEDHQVWVLSRNPQAASVATGAQLAAWDARTPAGWERLVEEADAIFNLAGENLGAHLWTPAHKEKVLSSRAYAGQAVMQALTAAKRRPGVLVQASAIGYYGASDDHILDEYSPAGKDWQARVCLDWEASTQEAERMGIRRVVVRTGLVLTKNGGVLPKLLLPFRLLVGGPLGSGEQFYSWITIQDEIRALLFLLKNENAAGVFNLTAPNPLTQAEFGRVEAQVLRQPYWFPTPAFAMRLALGEMSTLVVDGQRVMPKRLGEMGFSFSYEQLKPALQAILA